MAVEGQDDMANVPPHDRVCSYVGCLVDEPGNLVLRQLKTADFVGVYCREHDPLNDGEVEHMWEEYNGD